MLIAHLMQEAWREQRGQLRLDVVERGPVGTQAGELAADLAMFGDDGLQQAGQFLGGEQHAGPAVGQRLLELGVILGQAILQEAADDGGLGQLLGQRGRLAAAARQCVEAQFQTGVLLHVARQRFHGLVHGKSEEPNHALPVMALGHGRVVVDSDLDGIALVQQRRKAHQPLAAGGLQFQQFGQHSEVPAGVALAGTHDGVGSSRPAALGTRCLCPLGCFSG